MTGRLTGGTLEPHMLTLGWPAYHADWFGWITLPNPPYDGDRREPASRSPPHLAHDRAPGEGPGGDGPCPVISALLRTNGAPADRPIRTSLLRPGRLVQAFSRRRISLPRPGGEEPPPRSLDACSESKEPAPLQAHVEDAVRGGRQVSRAGDGGTLPTPIRPAASANRSSFVQSGCTLNVS